MKTAIRHFGQTHKVEFLEAGGRDDKLFVCGQEYGPTHLIKAGSYDEAYEAWLDEQPTISVEDVKDAFDNQGNLWGGHDFQPNAVGTGIVKVSEYFWMNQIK